MPTGTKTLAYSIGTTIFLRHPALSSRAATDMAASLFNGGDGVTRPVGTLALTYIGPSAVDANSRWLVAGASSVWIGTDSDVQCYLGRYYLVPSPSMTPTGVVRTLEYVPLAPPGVDPQSGTQLTRRMAEAAGRAPDAPAVVTLSECEECANDGRLNPIGECDDCGECYDHCIC